MRCEKKCGRAERFWDCGTNAVRPYGYAILIFVLLAVRLFGLCSFLCVRGVKIGAAVLKLLFCCDIIVLTRTV